MKHSVYFVLFCAFVLYMPISNAKKEKAKSKVVDSKVECPSTCKLKRRIGKVEATLTDQIQELINKFENANATNYQELTDSIQNLQQNLSQYLISYVNESVGELEVLLSEGQTAVQQASTDVTTLIQTIPTLISHKVQLQLSNNNIQNEQLITSLNTTIDTLKRHNRHLLRKVKSGEDLEKIIREQNDILSSQNRELRENNHRLSRKTDFLVEKLESLEGVVAFHNTTLGSNGGSNTGISPATLSSIDIKIRDAKSTAVDAKERVARIENWLSEAGSDGLRLPLLTPTTHPQPDSPPNDCQELFDMGYTESGSYRVMPWQSREQFDVYCEQSYYGGGWTVIQRRRDGSETFDRDWNDYALGFGNVEGEFWLGNEKIHQLTNQNTYRLHIVLLDWENNRAYAEYDGFKVSSSRDYYSIRFGAYRGTAGDAMRGMTEDGSRNLYLTRFGTRDLDNDVCDPCMYEGRAFTNCAKLQNGGWWYKACADANLNGRYVSREDLTSCNREDCYGINWRTWHNEVDYSLKATLMMIKTISPDQEEYEDS